MEFQSAAVLKDGRICTLRAATEADAAEVLRSFLATRGETEFLATYPEECTLTEQDEAAFLENAQEDPRAVQLVAELGGKIAGTAGIAPAGRGIKMKHRASFGIAVERAYWGLGIGRALTEACIACAKAAGYGRIELEVMEENTAAVRLYESLGFEPFGRDPGAFVTKDGRAQPVVWMRLPLTGA
ncbi:MAG: GNAT family N-acetyltransferase [Clostridia bacterium]|nr:GNAT family N-acetyltransferase [Clostridia bacterium]